MCTVTYLPLGDTDFILTSNRDEKPGRKTLPPKTYIEHNMALKYPKDALAGGTWIGLRDNTRLVCLLNGGFKNHVKKDTYRLSRGVVVKQILLAANAVNFINTLNLDDIEPFTLVLVDWQTTLEAHELVWDGVTKHFNKLPQKPHIWSSSTLYTDAMKTDRKTWFTHFLNNTANITQDAIVAFHKK
jgi:hypothetical protein